MKTCLHCNELANNGTMTLCNTHTDELRTLNRLKQKIQRAINKLSHKYYIADGDLGIEYRDSGAWRNYEINNAYGDTQEVFLANLTVSEIGQDGDDLNTYGFDDAPSHVQYTILKQTGIKL